MEELDPLPRRIVWFAPWTWKRRWLFVAVLIALFMAYPLSYGPACMLAVDGRMDVNTKNTIYLPLEWAMDHIPFVGQVMHQYVGLVFNLAGRGRNFGSG